MLRIFAGKESPDQGEVSLRKGIRTAFLDQDPDFGESVTVMDALFSGDDPKLSVVRRFRQLLLPAASDWILRRPPLRGDDDLPAQSARAASSSPSDDPTEIFFFRSTTSIRRRPGENNEKLVEMSF